MKSPRKKPVSSNQKKGSKGYRTRGTSFKHFRTKRSPNSLASEGIWCSTNPFLRSQGVTLLPWGSIVTVVEDRVQSSQYPSYCDMKIIFGDFIGYCSSACMVNFEPLEDYDDDPDSSP